MDVKLSRSKVQVFATLVAILFVGASSAGGIKWPKLPRIKWDPVKDVTGKNLNQVIKDRISNLGQQMEEFARNPLQYTIDLPRSVLMDICSSPGQVLEGQLAGQADGRWKSLPPQLIAALQSKYQGSNIAAVAYAENIRTPFAEGMTFGTRIYFPQSINLNDPSDLWWMLHELEHTVQYGRSNSDAETLCNYELKGLGNGFQHDRIDMERAANRKADGLIDYASQVMSVGGTQANVIQNALLAGNQMSVSNETEQQITFQIQGAGMPLERLVLDPHTYLIYSNTAGYTDFEFTIGTNRQRVGDQQIVGYEIQGGSLTHVFWNNQGQPGNLPADANSFLDLSWTPH